MRLRSRSETHFSLVVVGSGGNISEIMRRKSDADYAVKKSFSLPKRMAQGAEEKATQLGFGQFSDYLQMLIRRDLQPALTPEQRAT